MKTNIDIADLLGQDIILRNRVDDLLLYLENLKIESAVIDFAGVKFVTRSFADEYYNVIINHKTIKIKTINISEDIKMIFEAVRTTQNKKKDLNLNAKVIICHNYTELQNVFSSLML